MLFTVSLMIPLLVLAVCVFWRLTPPRPEPGPVRASNVAAVALGVALPAAVAWYVRGTMADRRRPARPA